METIGSLVIGLFLPTLVQYFKKKGLKATQAHLVVAIFLAGLYTAYQLWAPIPMKENAYQFITQASVTSVLLYEFFLKKKNNVKK